MRSAVIIASFVGVEPRKMFQRQLPVACLEWSLTPALVFLILPLTRRVEMSMITCHECASEISDTAKACPKCGAKVAHARIWPWIVGVPLGLFVVMMVIGMLSGGSSPTYTKDEICNQSSQAAYAIATDYPSMGLTGAVDAAIASGRYPAAGDKVVASTGLVVMTNSGMTPTRVSASVLANCKAAVQ